MWTWTVHLKSSCFSKAATSFETKDYRKLFEPFLNLVPLLCSCDLYLYTFLWSLGIYTDFRRSFYVMTSYGRGETRTARGWREWYSSPYCNFYQNITDVWPKREKKGFFKVDQQRQFALFCTVCGPRTRPQASLDVWKEVGVFEGARERRKRVSFLVFECSPSHNSLGLSWVFETF